VAWRSNRIDDRGPALAALDMPAVDRDELILVWWRDATSSALLKLVPSSCPVSRRRASQWTVVCSVAANQS
jgi:hypothetical protein